MAPVVTTLGGEPPLAWSSLVAFATELCIYTSKILFLYFWPLLWFASMIEKSLTNLNANF
jgi:hypothetical protein